MYFGTCYTPKEKNLNVGLLITRTFAKLILLLRLYYLHIPPHLLIGYPQEGLAGTRVAETTCAEMNVVQTGHSVYLRAKEECSYSFGQSKKKLQHNNLSYLFNSPENSQLSLHGNPQG